MLRQYQDKLITNQKIAFVLHEKRKMEGFMLKRVKIAISSLGEGRSEAEI